MNGEPMPDRASSGRAGSPRGVPALAAVLASLAPGAAGGSVALAAPQGHRPDRGAARVRLGLLGHRGAQPDERPHPLRAQRGEGVPPRLQHEARDDGGGARRLRQRRAAAHDASRRRGRLDGLGRILGDVYLVGRGDPNLSARFTPGRPTAAFEEMADALVAAGVRRIEGRVVGHEGAFTGDRRGSDWTWEDLAWGYGTEVSALSFADNLVEVTLKPGERVGDPAVLETVPRHGLPRRLLVGDDAEAPPPGSGCAGPARTRPSRFSGSREETTRGSRATSPSAGSGTAGWRCATRRCARRGCSSTCSKRRASA